MERRLVEQAMHGDEAAFDELVGRVGDRLFAGQTSPWEAGGGVEPDPDRHAEHVTQQRAIIDSIRFGERN